jgi:hypothetical protein
LRLKKPGWDAGGAPETGGSAVTLAPLMPSG